MKPCGGPHTMSRNAGKRARQALPKGASRGFRPRFRSRWQYSCEDLTSLPSRKSEALSERDLIRGSLEVVRLGATLGIRVRSTRVGPARSDYLLPTPGARRHSAHGAGTRLGRLNTKGCDCRNRRRGFRSAKGGPRIWIPTLTRRMTRRTPVDGTHSPACRAPSSPGSTGRGEAVYPDSRIPSSRARRTAAARPRTSSFLKMLRTW